MILKKIKKLRMEKNAQFPLILSAKVSRTTAEILLSYTGVDLYGYLDINQCIALNLKLNNQDPDYVSTIGVQITSQLEVLHRLGYTHGDIKLQNIMYNESNGQYTLSDFSQANKIYDEEGMHKP